MVSIESINLELEKRLIPYIGDYCNYSDLSKQIFKEMEKLLFDLMEDNYENFRRHVDLEVHPEGKDKVVFTIALKEDAPSWVLSRLNEIGNFKSI